MGKLSYKPVTPLYLKSSMIKRVDKVCRGLESNRGSLVLEATALSTEPQPLSRIRQKFHLKSCPKTAPQLTWNSDRQNR